MPEPAPATPVLSSRLIGLMAAATGLAVSCNYYAQPLLGTIATDLEIGRTSAGALVTTAQLAYGLGLLLLVPLGDRLERRSLIVWLMLASAAGLVVTGSAGSLGWAIVGTAITGLCTVVAQVLVPMAASLATPESRGRVVGALTSGLIAGILLGRTFAGALSALGGWRAVYWVSAPLLVLMSLLLWRALPVRRATSDMPYGRLLGSVFGLLRDHRALRLRALLGGLSFGAFSALWAPLALLLSAPPYGYGDAAIGLFGVVGLVGVLGASLAGRLADRGSSSATTLAGLLLIPAAWGILAFSGESLVALVTGIIVIDLAVQLVHVSNQSVIYARHPDARSRIAAGYMASYFVGGASGSALALGAFHAAGWAGAVAAGLVFGIAGLWAGRRLGRNG